MGSNIALFPSKLKDLFMHFSPTLLQNNCWRLDDECSSIVLWKKKQILSLVVIMFYNSQPFKYTWVRINVDKIEALLNRPCKALCQWAGCRVGCSFMQPGCAHTISGLFGISQPPWCMGSCSRFSLSFWHGAFVNQVIRITSNWF